MFCERLLLWRHVSRLAWCTRAAPSCRRCKSRRSVHVPKPWVPPISSADSVADEEVDVESDDDEGEFGELLRAQRIYERPATPSLLLLQPLIRFGPDSTDASNTSAELQLDEAVALIETLPGWRVSEKRVVSLETTVRKKHIWGRGKQQELCNLIQRSPDRISAVMVNIDRLSALQHAELFMLWRLPVYDRYTIVLQIFKAYAKTAEAKLQIALAEIPYLRQRLREVSDVELGSSDTFFGAQIAQLGGVRAPWQKWLELLKFREHRLRRRLERVRARGDDARRRRAGRRLLPLVAVVGYTNCGKTSLIGRLTADASLVPLDRLFATLDVTQHEARLPGGARTLLVDTIGFIANLPTTLVASFAAALDEVRHADVLVHLRDVSHPDRLAQRDSVLATLRSVDVGDALLEHMIDAGNKIDKLPPDVVDEELARLKADGSFPVSCATGEGLVELTNAIQAEAIRATGQVQRTFKLDPDSPILQFLRDEASITDTLVADDDVSLFVTAILTTANLGRLEAAFGAFKKTSVPKV